MKITLRLEEDGQESQSVEIETEPTQILHSIADKVAKDFDTDVEDILQCLAESRGHDSGNTSVAEFFGDERRSCRLRLVCITLHFEGESATRRFHASRTWREVHRWGCKRFCIAEDACPNLELRDGGVEGFLINENQKIGKVHGCKNVWLVAPGPEQNGK